MQHYRLLVLEQPLLLELQGLFLNDDGVEPTRDQFALMFAAITRRLHFQPPHRHRQR